MSRELEARRQQFLVRTLLGAAGAGLEEAGSTGLAPLHGVAGGAARGLLAYRGNAQGLAGKALGSNYPAVREELGEAQFEAMAWSFWRQRPPERGDLALWGGMLADFLADQPGMEPMLPDLAKLEWALAEAERAADAELDADSLALLGTHAPDGLRLCLRPGLTLLRLRAAAVASRRGDSTPGDAADATRDAMVDVLVFRRHWRAEASVIDAGWRDFLGACLSGKDLERALEHALGTHPNFDFSAFLQAALTETWLQAVVPITE